MSAPALLAVCAVSKSFGGVAANQEVSLAVAPGEIVGLIGPNGSGKSTLFNSIVGHHRIDAGRVLFGGTDITDRDEASIARLGLLRTFQQPRVYGKITCMQNMLASMPQSQEKFSDLFRTASGAAVPKAMELLRFVGLHEQSRHHAGELSYGQQKLLEFAMALMADARALLLDEPTAGINPAMIDTIVERLQQANQTLGLGLLIIEHNMRVIMALAQRIACMAQGRILALGTPAEIRADPRVIEAYLGSE